MSCGRKGQESKGEEPLEIHVWTAMSTGSSARKTKLPVRGSKSTVILFSNAQNYFKMGFLAQIYFVKIVKRLVVILGMYGISG
jgi:hypothetical protein